MVARGYWPRRPDFEDVDCGFPRAGGGAPRFAGDDLLSRSDRSADAPNDGTRVLRFFDMVPGWLGLVECSLYVCCG